MCADQQVSSPSDGLLLSLLRLPEGLNVQGHTHPSPLSGRYVGSTISTRGEAGTSVFCLLPSKSSAEREWGGMLWVFVQFDIYRKIPLDLTEATVHGGIMSAAAL